MTRSLRLSGDVALAAMQQRLTGHHIAGVGKQIKTGAQGQSGVRAATPVPAMGRKTPTVGRKQAPSALEEAMQAQLQAAGIAMVRQHKPIPGRRYRLDFAIPDRKLALEVDGMVHRISGRFLGDIRRHNVLILAGWRWVRAGREEIRSGQALADLRALLDR